MHQIPKQQIQPEHHITHTIVSSTAIIRVVCEVVVECFCLSLQYFLWWISDFSLWLYICVGLIHAEAWQKIQHSPKLSEPRQLDMGGQRIEKELLGLRGAICPGYTLRMMLHRWRLCWVLTCTIYLDSCSTAVRKEKQALSSRFTVLQLMAQRGQEICLVLCSNLVAEPSLDPTVVHISALYTPRLHQEPRESGTTVKREWKRGHVPFSYYLLFHRALIYLWLEDISYKLYHLGKYIRQQYMHRIERYNMMSTGHSGEWLSDEYGTKMFTYSIIQDN